MKDAARLGHRLGLDGIRLTADSVGRYAWLRCGFVPQQDAWEHMRQDMLRALALVMPHLEASRVQEVMRVLMDRDPKRARDIANLPDLVPTRIPTRDGMLFASLGRVLILEGTSSWVGDLKFDDMSSVKLLGVDWDD